MSSTAEVQKAVYSALTSDATLMAAITGVYDFVPEDASYPYVSIGDDTSTDDHNKDDDIEELTLVIHTWDQSEGRLNTKTIMGLVKDVLHRGALTITGHNLVFMYFEFSDTFRDPDGLTYRGVQRFRARIEKA